MLRILLHAKSEGGTTLRLARVAILTLPTLALTETSAIAQQPVAAPEILERMAKEKEARRTCKIEICNAFAKSAAGSPITCEVTKTWPQSDITSKVVGGSYIWQYGHTQCTVKLSLDRGLIANAMADGNNTVKFPEHSFICNVDDKDAAKGKAFTVTLSFTPTIVFEKGHAKSVTLEPVKAEGSSLASAAVTSLMGIDKVSGVVSRAAANEINEFLYSKCKEDGVEVPQK
jgi:hypothetical protein